MPTLQTPLGRSATINKVQLGDVSEILTGFPFKSERFTREELNPLLLRGDNVGQGVLRWDNAQRWPSSAIFPDSPYWLRGNDVIIAMDRPWIEAGLKFATVRTSDLPCLLVQRVARLRGKPGLDVRFLRYVIASKPFTDHVLAVQTGTTIPHISRDQIAQFEFTLPPRAEQRAIASILGALDDKIELNRKLSATLEAMARAIFTSWFVDFDPVQAKAEGRDTGLAPEIAALIPNGYASSLADLIPKTFRAGILSDLARLERSTISPFEFPEEVFQHFSIPAYDNGKRASLDRGFDIKSNKFALSHQVVLVSKLNPENPRVWIPDISKTFRAVSSTEFLPLYPTDRAKQSYLFMLLCDVDFRKRMTAHVSGTSNSHQRIDVTTFLALPIFIPSIAMLAAFDNIVTPMLSRMLMAYRDSRTLEALRDTLLPKLISGEFRWGRLTMEDRWRSVPLSEVTHRITKGTTPTTVRGSFCSSGISFVKVESITANGRIDVSRLAYIDTETDAILSRSRLQHDDILFTIAGTIGRVSLVDSAIIPGNTNQAVAIIRPDQSKIEPRFLYFALRDSSRINEAKTRVVQSVQANFSLSELSRLNVPLPSLKEQREIVSILGALDDKIELNRKISATLEAVARALFKSWFVDFEPVRAKAEGRDPRLPAEITALFPDSFSNSNAGEIPTGWHFGTVNDLCISVSSGGTPARQTREYWDNGSIPWFKTGELQDRPLLISSEHITDVAVKQSSCKLWPAGTILFALYASPTVGRMGLLTKEGTSNQAAAGLLADGKYGTPFLFQTLFLSRQDLQHIAVGAAQQNINLGVLKAHKVIVPPSQLAGWYSAHMRPLVDRQIEIVQESATLASIRDALLPKLISGELRVGEAERVLEAST